MKKLIIGAGLSMLVASTACYAATQPGQNPGLLVELTVASATPEGVCLLPVGTSEPPQCASGFLPSRGFYQNLPGSLTLQLSVPPNTMNVGDANYPEDASCQKYFPLDQRKYQTKGKAGEVDIKMKLIFDSSTSSYKLVHCLVVDGSYN